MNQIGSAQLNWILAGSGVAAWSLTLGVFFYGRNRVKGHADQLWQKLSSLWSRREDTEQA